MICLSDMKTELTISQAKEKAKQMSTQTFWHVYVAKVENSLMAKLIVGFHYDLPSHGARVLHVYKNGKEKK